MEVKFITNIDYGRNWSLASRRTWPGAFSSIEAIEEKYKDLGYCLYTGMTVEVFAVPGEGEASYYGDLRRVWEQEPGRNGREVIRVVKRGE